MAEEYQPPVAADTHRERWQSFGEAEAHHGRAFFLGSLVAVLIFLLVLAVSLRQVTQPSPARHLIEAGIAVTTDIDRLIAEDREPLKQLAESSTNGVIAIPGYPLKVYLMEQEATGLSDDALRRLILERSSALVYEQGLGAFDHTGQQSFSLLSTQGLLNRMAGQLSSSTNDDATLASIILAVLTAAAAAGLVVTLHDWWRLRGLGIAVLVGSVPGVAFFVAGWLIAGWIGGSDSFTEQLRTIGRSGLMVPLRNYAIVAGLGLLFVAGGIVFPIFARRGETLYEEDFESDYGDAESP